MRERDSEGGSETVSRIEFESENGGTSVEEEEEEVDVCIG